jgi:uncharacterized membrane-anchored protein
VFSIGQFAFAQNTDSSTTTNTRRSDRREKRGALEVAGLIALVAALHYFTKISDSVLFWAAYVLTRPLGATLGDTLTKPHADGGLDLSRITSSLVIAAIMVVMIFLTYRMAEQFPDPSNRARA